MWCADGVGVGESIVWCLNVPGQSTSCSAAFTASGFLLYRGDAWVIPLGIRRRVCGDVDKSMVGVEGCGWREIVA